MTKSERRIAALSHALAKLIEAARKAVEYECVAAVKWQPAGSRRSVTANLDRALYRAEAALRKVK